MRAPGVPVAVSPCNGGSHESELFDSYKVFDRVCVGIAIALLGQNNKQSAASGG